MPADHADDVPPSTPRNVEAMALAVAAQPGPTVTLDKRGVLALLQRVYLDAQAVEQIRWICAGSDGDKLERAIRVADRWREGWLGREG